MSIKQFDREEVLELLENGCKEAILDYDLRGADLRSTDLEGVDLRGADLSKANLSRTEIGRASCRERV